MWMSCLPKIRLFISPCPNDTFAFYALLHDKTDREGLDFEVAFEDIETLNGRALRGDGDVVKASIAVAGRVDYELLSAGAALGRGNGPVVVQGCGAKGSVALPGTNTVAALLFRRYFKGYSEREVVFSEVAAMVERGESEMGVLIHEGRFTFGQRGLTKIADLGELWERETGLPLPLGGIFARRGLSDEIRRRVERSIRRSVEWAIANPEAPMDFVRLHARELSPDVLRSHIDYFVNDHTVEIGAQGTLAIEKLLK